MFFNHIKFNVSYKNQVECDLLKWNLCIFVQVKLRDFSIQVKLRAFSFKSSWEIFHSDHVVYDSLEYRPVEFVQVLLISFFVQVKFVWSIQVKLN